MLLRKLASFSTKKANFFWTEINPCVKEAEYAVRGVVPTLANAMQTNIKKGVERITLTIQTIHSSRSPSATSATLRSSARSPLLSSGRWCLAC